MSSGSVPSSQPFNSSLALPSTFPQPGCFSTISSKVKAVASRVFGSKDSDLDASDRATRGSFSRREFRQSHHSLTSEGEGALEREDETSRVFFEHFTVEPPPRSDLPSSTDRIEIPIKAEEETRLSVNHQESHRFVLATLPEGYRDAYLLKVEQLEKAMQKVQELKKKWYSALNIFEQVPIDIAKEQQILFQAEEVKPPSSAFDGVSAEGIKEGTRTIVDLRKEIAGLETRFHELTRLIAEKDKEIKALEQKLTNLESHSELCEYGKQLIYDIQSLAYGLLLGIVNLLIGLLNALSKEVPDWLKNANKSFETSLETISEEYKASEEFVEDILNWEQLLENHEKLQSDLAKFIKEQRTTVGLHESYGEEFNGIRELQKEVLQACQELARIQNEMREFFGSLGMLELKDVFDSLDELSAMNGGTTPLEINAGLARKLGQLDTVIAQIEKRLYRPSGLGHYDSGSDSIELIKELTEQKQRFIDLKNALERKIDKGLADRYKSLETEENELLKGLDFSTPEQSKASVNRIEVMKLKWKTYEKESSHWVHPSADDPITHLSQLIELEGLLTRMEAELGKEASTLSEEDMSRGDLLKAKELIINLNTLTNYPQIGFLCKNVEFCSNSLLIKLSTRDAGFSQRIEGLLTSYEKKKVKLESEEKKQIERDLNTLKFQVRAIELIKELQNLNATFLPDREKLAELEFNLKVENKDPNQDPTYRALKRRIEENVQQFPQKLAELRSNPWALDSQHLSELRPILQSLDKIRSEREFFFSFNAMDMMGADHLRSLSETKIKEFTQQISTGFEHIAARETDLIQEKLNQIQYQLNTIYE